MPEKTLGELAEYVGGRVCGDPNVVIRSTATLGRAEPGAISFLTNRKYEKQLRATKASAVIVGITSKRANHTIIAKTQRGSTFPAAT